MSKSHSTNILIERANARRANTENSEREANRRPVETWIDDEEVQRIIRGMHVTPQEARWLAYQITEVPPHEQPYNTAGVQEYLNQTLTEYRNAEEGDRPEIPEGETAPLNELLNDQELQTWEQIRFFARGRGQQNEAIQERLDQAIETLQRANQANQEMSLAEAQDLIEAVYNRELIFAENLDYLELVEEWITNQREAFLATVPQLDQIEPNTPYNTLEDELAQLVNAEINELIQDLPTNELVNAQEVIFTPLEQTIRERLASRLPEQPPIPSQLRQREWMQHLINTEGIQPEEAQQLHDLLAAYNLEPDEAQYLANQLANYTGGQQLTLEGLRDQITWLLHGYPNTGRDDGPRRQKEIVRRDEHTIEEWLQDAEIQAYLLLLYTPQEIEVDLNEIDLVFLQQELGERTVTIEEVRRELLRIIDNHNNDELDDTVEANPVENSRERTQITDRITQLANNYPDAFAQLPNNGQLVDRFLENPNADQALARLEKNLAQQQLSIENRRGSGTATTEQEPPTNYIDQYAKLLTGKPRLTRQELQQAVTAELIQWQKEFPNGYQNMEIDFDQIANDVMNGALSPEEFWALRNDVIEADYYSPVIENKPSTNQPEDQEKLPPHLAELRDKYSYAFEKMRNTIDVNAPYNAEELETLEQELRKVVYENEAGEIILTPRERFENELQILLQDHDTAAKQLTITADKITDSIFGKNSEKQVNDLRLFLTKLENMLKDYEQNAIKGNPEAPEEEVSPKLKEKYSYLDGKKKKRFKGRLATSEDLQNENLRSFSPEDYDVKITPEEYAEIEKADQESYDEELNETTYEPFKLEPLDEKTEDEPALLHEVEDFVSEHRETIEEFELQDMVSDIYLVDAETIKDEQDLAGETDDQKIETKRDQLFKDLIKQVAELEKASIDEEE